MPAVRPPWSAAGIGAAVALSNISKDFPGQRALDDVSVALRAGEVVALLGENGSGKSTLIKILAGVYTPEPGGTVMVHDRHLELGSLAASHGLGLRFVHQELGLIEDLSAMENLALSAGYVQNRFGAIRWRAEAARASRLLGRLDAHFDVREPVAWRSAVERTAIAVARALWDWDEGGGVALVLDEPTATMPPADVQRLFEIVRAVCASGAAVLYVSHRLDEIVELADRACVLREGRLVADEPAKGLDGARLARLMLGRDPDLPARSTTDEERARSPRSVLRVSGLPDGLEHVDLDIAEGEIVGVTGLQGSGRETLPYAVTERVRAGSKAENAGDVTPRHAAIVPVDRLRRGSIPSFTVRENFALVGSRRFRHNGVLRKSRERAALSEWAERLDLAYTGSEQVFGTLSGGNQQKVILSRWLAMRPELMVIDEPTHGVDIGARVAIHDVIRHFASEGVGFVLCSSDVPDLMAVATRILVLSKRRVVAEFTGTFDEHAILEAMMAGSAA